jgi:glycosyltransferase involved in cell wall biosynthesis
MKSNSDSETGNPIPRLSIVIATRNRASYLAETLKNIVGDGGGRVEIVVVDGASSDDTERVVGELAGRHPEIRYFREQTNSGVDGDYDKGVAYARTEYCWLLSDDDLLVAGAVDTVLQALATSGQPDIVVANAGVWSADMSQQLSPRRLPFDETRGDCPESAVDGARPEAVLRDGVHPCRGHLPVAGNDGGGDWEASGQNPLRRRQLDQAGL